MGGGGGGWAVAAASFAASGCRSPHERQKETPGGTGVEQAGQTPCFGPARSVSAGGAAPAFVASRAAPQWRQNFALEATWPPQLGHFAVEVMGGQRSGVPQAPQKFAPVSSGAPQRVQKVVELACGAPIACGAGGTGAPAVGCVPALSSVRLAGMGRAS